MNGGRSKPSHFSFDFWWLLGCCLAGLILRLDFLVPNSFVIDSDEAIVGLMAKHISEGGAWPVFYYGQHYMGSGEALLAALLFKPFGVSNVSLVVVPLLFSLFLIPLTFALTARIASSVGARIASALMALPPAALVVWSAKARGGFIEVVFLAGAALLLTMIWMARERPAPGRTFWLWVIIGLGWWTNNQIIFAALPISIFMGLRLLRDARVKGAARVRRICFHALIALAGFALGGLPFWYYNLTNNFASFGIFHHGKLQEIAEHFRGLFLTGLPILAGAKRFWQTADIFPGASWVVLVLYGTTLLIVLLIRLPSLGDLMVLRIDRRKPVELLLVYEAGCVAIFAVSSYGWLYEAPRYLLPLYPAAFALVGYAADCLWRHSRAICCLFIAPFLLLHGASNYWGGRALPGEPFVFGGERVSKDHTQLIEWLAATNNSFVRTNYWIGYRLAFETNEQVRFITFGEPHESRIEKYREAGASYGVGRMPFVLVPTQAVLVRKALDVLGYHYKETHQSGYDIVFDVAPSQVALEMLAPSDLVVSASAHGETAPNAIDGRLDTRWGSGTAQRPGMKFEVQLKNPLPIRGISLALGRWGTDFPRGLAVEVHELGGATRSLLNPGDWEAVRYLFAYESTIRFYFAPIATSAILFTQVGSDPIFDWSIAELEVWR